jgi:VCBS repeat-containing protein
MGMARLAPTLTAVFFALVALVSTGAQAQTLTYDVLLDLDRNTNTGCDVTPSGSASTVAGIERRLRATVDSNFAMVTEVSVERCNGSSFDTPTVVGGPHPVGLNIGINGSDVVELAASLSALEIGNSNPVQFIFLAEDNSGNDILATEDGTPGSGGILFGLPLGIPALSAFGLALLAGLLLILAWRHNRATGSLFSVLLLLMAAGLVIAASFVTDGNIDDWAGQSPRATDPAGDSSNAAAGNDIQAAFIGFENNHLFFRLDITDTENQPPVAGDDNFNVDEDNPLSVGAPGVLGNDSDANMDAITAVLVNGPGNAASFTLNANGSFDYTPATDFNGTDTFTYVADDGSSQSAPATVSITVNPVNDSPLAQDDVATTDEDDTVDISVLTNDSDVDGNLDPSSVTVITPPSNGSTLVNGAGVITYTKANDFNGSDSFEYEVCDDGTPLPAECDTATVTITVNSVNDAPSFTVGPDQNVAEDAGPQSVAAWATNISAGPADENTQNLTFNVSSNTNAALFSAGPAVDASGVLSYTPADDAFGSATITLELMDDGGTANGGVDTSAAATFNITIDAVNDAPSFANIGDQTVLEDSGVQSIVWANSINAGPGNESAQVLTFNLSANTNPGLFSVQPSIDSSGTLTYTPAANANGSADITVNLSDDGGTANGGQDTSPNSTLRINVTAVNDEPSFVAGPDVPVFEDAGAVSIPTWATGISAGPADESAQTLNFVITGNTNAGLFAAAPQVNSSGDLSFTPQANASGTATITLELTDNGGTANGGDDTSAPQSFTITVTAVNDAPTITLGPDETIIEDSGPQTVNAWATNISPGPADEAGQTVTVNIVGNDNAALFTAGPSIDNAGNLTYTPAANASGVATIMVTVSDDGGTANGGVDTSPNNAFSITINNVNDAPSFAVGPDQNINEDAGAQTINGWATGISAGPASEIGQALNFIVSPQSSDSTLSFSSGPSVDPANGNLSYTVSANAYGSATFNISLQDNGGTANGGIDTFGPLSFSINVAAQNDPPTVGAAPSFNVTTNIQIDVPAGNGLLVGASDEATEAVDPNGPAAPGTNVTVGNGSNPAPTTSVNGGNVAINTTTGAFSYNPPPGFTGTDTFNYVICDDGIGAPGPICSAPITATFNVSGNTVWFIDNSVTGGADNGRLTTPFESLDSFLAAQGGGSTQHPAAGDFIFLAAPTPTTNYLASTPVALLDNQVIFGSAVVGTSFDALTGITAAPNSAPRPVLAGNHPTITPVNNGFQANASAGNQMTIRALNIGSTAGTAIAANVGGTVNIMNVGINTNGRLVNIDGSGVGTLNAQFNALTTTSAAVAFRAVNLTGSVVQTSGFNLGVTNVAGIELTNNTGGSTFTFNGLTEAIVATGPVFNLNNTGTVTVSSAAPVSIGTTTGSVMTISNTTVNGFAFNNIDSGGGNFGIVLNNVTGSISALNGNIFNTTMGGIDVNGGTVNLSFPGLINTLGHSVRVQNHLGGTLSFGQITELAGNGILLTNNPSSIINFQDTLNITTTGNAAFTAINSGTVSATGVTSEINSTNAEAVIISDTTIAAAGFTVDRVDASNGVNGIMLNNTGNTGGLFRVLGDGLNLRNGSGGTITNTTGDGIVLMQNNGAQFTSMNLVSVGDSSDLTVGGNNLSTNDHAIQSEMSSNIVLSAVSIQNPAAGGWEAVELGGVNRIDNDTVIEGITTSNMQALEVRNTNATLTNFVINDSNFRNQGSTNGSSYVIFSNFGNAAMNVTVENLSTFENLFGHALQLNAGEGVGSIGSVTFNLADSVFQNAVDGTVGVGASGGIGGVIAAAREGSTNNFAMNNNTFTDLGRPLANSGVVVTQAIGGMSKTLDGSFTGNTASRIGFPDALAGTTTVGHRFFDVVSENEVNRVDFEGRNNAIDNTSREAFFVSSRDTSSDFDIALSDNQLGQITPIGQTEREAIEILSEDASVMQADIINNMIAGNTNLDQVVDIDTENTSVMNVRFNGNTVTNAGTGTEIVVDTENGTSVHCMEFNGNTADAAEFDVNGNHQFEDFTNVTANNPGIGVVLDGAGVTNVPVATCSHPDF